MAYCAFLCFCLWQIPESPKFLYTNRMFNEARAKLKEVARWNGNKLSPEEIDQIVFDLEVDQSLVYTDDAGNELDSRLDTSDALAPDAGY